MTQAPPQQPPRTRTPLRQEWHAWIISFLSGYFWIIFKNVIGWLFIISAPIAGVLVPGPGGLPLFILGFALVTFPGKRKLTSRVMRGRGLPIDTEVFVFVTVFFSIIATTVLMWFVAGYVSKALSEVHLDPEEKNGAYAGAIAGLIVTGLIALGVTWVVSRLSLKVLNYFLRAMPWIRRRSRPWLRKHGLNLLPSRHKQPADGVVAAADEILEIDQRHHDRVRAVGGAFWQWGKRILAASVTVGIFYFILKPIQQHWPEVRERILSMSIATFLLASAMFSVFLFVFRASLWRRILGDFGYPVPRAPALRIWSTSELARYLPGAIWQVMGRVYLARPYGVPGSVTSVSQLLELMLFLIANLLVAVTCVGYYGFKHLEGNAWIALVVAAVLLPLLLGMLHTKVFYGLVNTVMRRVNKPLITQRVRGKELPKMVAWNVLGLGWQALALFVLMRQPLGLKIDWLWTLAGAYCLAWCAGFLAFWAPGGIGVREAVFIGAMQLISPEIVKNDSGFVALVAFLSVLTRLWTVCGEILLALVAYILDWRGALGGGNGSAPPMRKW